MFNVITIGSASRDIFFTTSRGKIIPDPSSIEGRLLAFILGAKVSIESAYISDGGGACNAATAFARLGLKVAPYMNVGRDEMGEQIILELVQEGADTQLIRMDEKLLTGTSVILIPAGIGDRTILFYSGANRNLRIRDWQKIEDTSWFYVGPITREAPELPHQIADFAQQKSIKMANNPGLGQIELGFEYMSPVLEMLDVLIVNRAEATLLLRSKDPSISISDNRQLAAELIKTGPKIVAVTCGSEGSYATEGGEIYFQEAIKTDIADVTGAGDSFGSTFVAAIIMGYDIKAAMLMAAINAASVVSQLGAQEGLLRLDEIRRSANSALETSNQKQSN
ncbi:MAG: carbohydrate kinase family protein [Actinobacteria bacterium]|nr:carbohydrate kinase family protein [Actinomycetota bacterium]